VLRYTAIRALGGQWTTRVVVDRAADPVTSGPYRFLTHPNYVAVVVEILAVPASVGARGTALVFTALDGVLLRHRVAVERAACVVEPVSARRDRASRQDR
jgi:methyltransferase